MGIDQLLRLVADSGAVGGFVFLSSLCFLWAQRVGEMNLNMIQKMDELARRDDRMIGVITQLTLTMVASAPDGKKDELVKLLRESLEDRREVGK